MGSIKFIFIRLQISINNSINDYLPMITLSNLLWRYNFSLMRGKFIVLEGVDRCGKSSMTKFLQQKLSEGESKAISIGFPNRKSITGQMINDFLSNKTDVGKQAIHLLFSANRWEAMKEIEDYLEKGVNIVCDRYWYSGVAYSYSKGLDFQWCMASDKGLLQPDLVLFLKADPSKLTSREGYGSQRFENVEFQKKVSEGFQKLLRTLNKENIKTINVDNKTLPEVKQQVFTLVQSAFQPKLN